MATVLINRWRSLPLALFCFSMMLNTTQICAFDLTAPVNYSKDLLTAGSVYYLDRSYTITAQPNSFDGYQAILTRNDDQNLDSSTHIQFTLTAASSVYVCYDSRATTTPTWLDNSWTLTGDTVEVSDADMGHFEVYQKDFPAGVVALGGNVDGGATGAESMYIVYIDEFVALSADIIAVDVANGGVLPNAVQISGGSKPYTIVTVNNTIATAILSGDLVSITGVSSGTTSITVSDDSGAYINIDVTVLNDIVANPNSIALPVGGLQAISIGGGASTYIVGSMDTTVALVTMDNATNTIAVAGVTEGSTSISAQDAASDTISIPVSVYAPLAVDSTVVNILKDATTTVTVSGGAGSYSVLSNNSYIAIASISGSTLTITGGTLGSATITVTDADDNRIVVGVVVGVASGGLLESCPAPPFVGGGSVAPNIMLILDHSGSMGSGDGSRWDVAKQVMNAIIDQFPSIRFGLMRMDGSDYVGQSVIGNETVVRQGGKILRAVGSSHDSIKTYINNWGDSSNNPQTWTVLAEVLASAGQYFATTVEAGNRVGKGPAELGYYQKNYTYDIVGTTYDATTTDDKGNSIDTLSPIQFYCQQSFVILVTDGESNYDNDWDVVTTAISDYDGDNEASDCSNGTSGCSDTGRTTYLDDVAQFLYEHDMRSDPNGASSADDLQNITTYVVGFNTDFPLLEQAASQGGGKYYTATDYAGLLTSLQDAIQDILFKTSSGTSVATVSTSSSSQDYLLRAKFVPGEWQGSLEAFSLPYLETDTPVWSATDLLNIRSADTRNIFTSISAAKQDFVTTNTTVTDLMKSAGYWNESDAETNDIINYIRGDQTYDGGKYWDRKGWLLGDIIHSTPVSVGAPKFPYSENGYWTFRSSKYSRPTLVYVGANDGMLHAFYTYDDPDTSPPLWEKGEEAWTFIPENVQKNLKDLTVDCHKYFVDLNPLVVDVWDSSWDIDGVADDSLPANVVADGWKTVLIGGNRLGGEEYFALDVSDPADHNNVQVLWDNIPFSDSVRKSSNLPVVGKMKPVDKWLAVITSGYHEGTATGRIAALDMASGSKQTIWNDGTSNVDELETQAKSTSSYYTLSAPVAFDSSEDGYFDLIYAGDTEGTLWKFYFDYVGNIWKQVPLFNTGGAPITGRPTLVPDANGWLRIYFGTGKYLVDLDKIDTARNAFYSIIEKPVSTGDANNGHFTGVSPLVLSDLQDMTIVMNTTDFAALTADEQTAVENVGWYILLDDPQGLPGERVLGIPLVFAGSVLFTSFKPNEDACGAGGVSKLYALDFLYGYQAIVNSSETVLRSSSGGNIPGGDRSIELGAGLASDPVLYFNRDTGESTLIVQTSDTTVHKKKVNLGVKPMALRSWREVEN